MVLQACLYLNIDMSVKPLCLMALSCYFPGSKGQYNSME